MLQQSNLDVIYCAVDGISQRLVERTRLIKKNLSKTAALVVFVNHNVTIHDEWMAQNVSIRRAEFDNPVQFELFDAWQHLTSYNTAMLVPEKVP